MFRFVSANLQVNKFKNRLVNILPFESSRVCLQPMRGMEGSDYINASFIDGYRYLLVVVVWFQRTACVSRNSTTTQVFGIDEQFCSGFSESFRIWIRIYRS
jgi:hypothetical protein